MLPRAGHRGALAGLLLVACTDRPPDAGSAGVGTSSTSSASPTSSPTTSGSTGGAATTEPAASSEGVTDAATVADSATLTSDGATTTGTTGAATSDLEDTTEATTHASDTVGQDTVTCECILPDQHELDSFDWAACGWGPCGTIEFWCVNAPIDGGAGPPPCPNGGIPTLDLTAVDCAIELLISGDSGMVHWYESTNSNFSRSGAYVRITADSTGLARSWAWVDLGGTEGQAELIMLKDPDYFVGCKALESPYLRYQCLKDWKKAALETVCDPGGCYGFEC